MRTPSPRRAPFSTIAVAWTSHFGIIRIQDHGADFRLSHNLTIDLRFAVKPPSTPAAAHLPHMVVQLIAWQYRLAELGAINPHEINELGLVGGVEVGDAQRPGRLRQPFDDEHARHDRKIGEMPLEEGLVHGHALDANRALVPVHVDDAVYQQERIAMWQQFHHPIDVGRAELLRGSRLCHLLPAPNSQNRISTLPRWLALAGPPLS